MIVWLGHDSHIPKRLVLDKLKWLCLSSVSETEKGNDMPVVIQHNTTNKYMQSKWDYGNDVVHVHWIDDIEEADVFFRPNVATNIINVEKWNAHIEHVAKG